jgi:hypothetical protein
MKQELSAAPGCQMISIDANGIIKSATLLKMAAQLLPDSSGNLVDPPIKLFALLTGQCHVMW